MITEAFVRLQQRRAEMETNVFLYPPTDWSEFQRRFGQWIELTNIISDLEAIIKGKEKDDEHVSG